MKPIRSVLSLLIACWMLPQMTAAAQGYGQGKTLDGKNRPVGAVQFQEEFADLNAHALTEDETRIILTFDQGYENGYTPRILDTLKEKHATAIFFLTGDYAKKEPELVRRMIAEGHVLGNHGMRHAAIPTLSEEALEEEVMSLHNYVLEHFDYEM